MSYLHDHLDDMTEAIGQIDGLRVAMDPQAMVPPCLLIDYTPTPVRETACGEVMEWKALLIPAITTGWLAAQWLADHRLTVVHQINTVGEVTAEEGVQYATGTESTAVSVPAYQITYQA